MEIHPEFCSEGKRLEIKKRIHAEYSRIGHDFCGLARDLLDLRPNDSVLDAGCGLGDFLIGIRKAGHFGKLIGIDRSIEMIEDARRVASFEKIEVDFHIGDAEKLAFPSGSFDCVTALHLLGGANPSTVLPELGRVLKGGGRLVVSTNSRMSYPILNELKKRARERFGWFIADEYDNGFESEIAPDILRRYFGIVEESRYEDALQYPDAEVLVDLFRSTRGQWSASITETEWDRIVDWARDQALELIPEHGYAEDPKSFSFFRCTAPLGL